MAKTVALLLTLWLALSLKGQTYMLEAERFQYVGGWKVEKDVEAFNKAVLMVTAGGVLRMPQRYWMCLKAGVMCFGVARKTSKPRLHEPAFRA